MFLECKCAGFRAARRRPATLHALVSRLRARALAARIGQTRPVLFEGRREAVAGGVRRTGYTDTYQPVAVTLPTDRPLRGRVLPVRIDAVEDGARLVGTLT